MFIHNFHKPVDLEQLCKDGKFFGESKAVPLAFMNWVGIFNPHHDLKIRKSMEYIDVLLQAITYCNKRLHWLMFWYIQPYDRCIKELNVVVAFMLKSEERLKKLTPKEREIFLKAVQLLWKKPYTSE